MKDKLSKFLRCLEVERGCSKGTIGVYGQQLEQGLIPFLHQRGRSDVGEVTRDDVRGYLDFLAFERGNSGVTRRRKLAAIRSFFNYLVDSEGLKANPAAGIKSPAVPEREPVCLIDQECRRLLETVAREARPRVRERDSAMLLLFLHAGLRVSELINLRLKDVDLKGRQIRIKPPFRLPLKIVYGVERSGIPDAVLQAYEVFGGLIPINFSIVAKCLNDQAAFNKPQHQPKI